VLFLTFKSAVKIETGLKPVNHKQFSHVNGHKKTKAGGFLVGLLFFYILINSPLLLFAADHYFTSNHIRQNSLNRDHFIMVGLRGKNVREGFWKAFKAASIGQLAG
jgi:hypothetical protein